MDEKELKKYNIQSLQSSGNNAVQPQRLKI